MNKLKMTEQDCTLIQQVVEIMADFVPRTACRYCEEDCPQGLKIPTLISMYNELKMDGVEILNFTLGAYKEDELPKACINCKTCERVYPKGIKISEVMSDFQALLTQARK